VRRSALAVAVLLVRCHAGQNQDERTTDTAPAPTREALPAEEPSAAPTASEGDARPCAPALRVSARVLAAEWPLRLGQRVLLRVRTVRATGVGEAVVVSGGTRFVVLAAPGARLDGVHTFVVTGSATVRLGGRVQLPELLLDDSCAS